MCMRVVGGYKMLRFGARDKTLAIFTMQSELLAYTTIWGHFLSAHMLTPLLSQYTLPDLTWNICFFPHLWVCGLHSSGLNTERNRADVIAGPWDAAGDFSGCFNRWLEPT